MAMVEFLDHVRIGASFLSPETWADAAHASAEETARARQLADIWLTPAVVNGYSEADFVSLPAGERERLREAVAEFRAVARGVNPGGPSTPEQIDRALPPFFAVLDVVRPYIAGREALDVRRAVWQACRNYRDWIPSFTYKLDWDSEGAPAVWVWLILNNDVDVTTRDTQLRLWAVRNAIRDELSRAGIERPLYGSVWKRQEVAPVVLGGAAA